MRSPRVCFVITEDWYFWSHRRLLAEFLIKQGWRVDLVTNFGKLQHDITAAGIIVHSVGLRRTSKQPIDEAKTVARMAALFRRIQPDVVHLVGMKPIVYGSMAARLARVPATVCAVAGMGWLFTPGGRLKAIARSIVKNYFRICLSGRKDVRFVVQNTHHASTLIQSRMALSDQMRLIPGAGVDVNRFRYSSETRGVPTVLLHARMLWDKGIGDLVEAARLLKRSELPCRFLLVGDPDPANPASIPESQLRAWDAEGVVSWQGRRNDMPRILSNSHIACLPSYHEGFPLSLVEALASGRPVVTTKIPGCRDVVEDRKTGLLVEPKRPVELACAISELLLNPSLRQEMGRCGRQRVEQCMSSEIVNRRTVECYREMLGDFSVLQNVASKDQRGHRAGTFPATPSAARASEPIGDLTTSDKTTMRRVA